MDQTLIQEILEVVEQAAIASAKLTGLGKKDEADAAAVEKEAAEKAAAEAIVYIKCPHCRHLCYIF